MTEGGPAAAGPPEAPAAAPISRRRVLLWLELGAGGGIVAGAVAGRLIANRPTDAWQLEPLPTSALAEAETTLAAEPRDRLIEAARRCREPLARVAIWRDAAAAGGLVSFISGIYRSPRFALSVAPSLVALPFPAAYASGHGELIVVGEANGFGIALKPSQMHARINGTLSIPVWWTPVEGCP